MIERFALIKPAIDAHTLGLNTLAELLRECGYEVVLSPPAIAEAIGQIKYQSQRRQFVEWLQEQNISHVGVSYRLDPEQAVELVGYLVHELLNGRMFAHQGGPLRGFYFAGLKGACLKIDQEYHGLVKTFQGGETTQETLLKLGIPEERIPFSLMAGSAYDEDRLAFGRELIKKGDYAKVRPFPQGKSYAEFGGKKDSLEKRYASLGESPQRPLFRAHAGPYTNVKEFLGWVENLARAGFLDILSIGTSQLSQSNFGEDWGERPNGGGVPINSAQEYAEIWNHSRPLLVRTYAGTKDIPKLAALYEKTINICWHALSFWWFNQLDGRGPYSLLENLHQHFQTAEWIAQSGKPLEANVSHHFAFRGSDDLSYVVSAYLTAKLAKRKGIRTFILQNMLNTPRQTWGIQDLAKSRALLLLTKSLEDQNFKVFLQPRAGLDYFSPNLEEAKAQLAAVTALMDDIDPRNETSPPLIHVVSYSEGSHLATPAIINESIQITYHALERYRDLRQRGMVSDQSTNELVQERTAKLLKEAQTLIKVIEEHIPQVYTAEGFYKVFMSGFLPIPYLWTKGEEYKHACHWNTRYIQGGIVVVDGQGEPISLETRIDYALSHLPEVEYLMNHVKRGV